jgi:Adenylate and Guanylate cyclase catalytic domain
MALDQSQTPTLEIAHVLFMDIVAYSQLPMDQQRNLLRHFQQLVSTTSEFIRAKTRNELITLPTGDGMALVFFGDAEAPARCALEICRALRNPPEIQLRMGLHTGPVYRVEDVNANRNVAGGGINVAQRVMDCGDAGHILLSSAVAEVLGQLSTWADCLHDLGEVEVKHGLRLHLFNFWKGELGNPERPRKLRSGSAIPGRREAEIPEGDKNDSLWKKWYYRVGVVVGVVTILGFLLSPNVRDVIGELFGKKPAVNVASGPGNPTERSGPAPPGKAIPEGPKPDIKEKPLEPRPLVKALPGQYISTAILRHEGMKRAAILVRQGSGESLPSLESAIASLLAKRGVDAVQSFFKPAFIQEGQAKSLFAGDWTVSEQLQLGRHVDYVLIGFGKVTYSSNQELGGLLTANFELELKCLNVVSQRICDSKTFNTPGAGYTEGTALQNAVERLQQQLESFVREAF